MRYTIPSSSVVNENDGDIIWKVPDVPGPSQLQLEIHYHCTNIGMSTWIK